VRNPLIANRLSQAALSTIALANRPHRRKIAAASEPGVGGMGKGFTIDARFGRGVFLALGFVGLASAGMRVWHAAAWERVEARVAWSGELCRMRREGSGSSVVEAAIPCGEIDAFKAARPQSQWTSEPVVHVRLDPPVAGGEPVPWWSVSGIQPAEGDRLAYYADPEGRARFDRAPSIADLTNLAIALAFGAVVWVAASIYGRRNPSSRR
jgi:hypothetical protein